MGELELVYKVVAMTHLFRKVFVCFDLLLSGWLVDGFVCDVVAALVGYQCHVCTCGCANLLR